MEKSGCEDFFTVNQVVSCLPIDRQHINARFWFEESQTLHSQKGYFEARQVCLFTVHGIHFERIMSS